MLCFALLVFLITTVFTARLTAVSESAAVDLDSTDDSTDDAKDHAIPSHPRLSSNFMHLLHQPAVHDSLDMDEKTQKRRKPTFMEDADRHARNIRNWTHIHRHDIAGFAAALPVALAVGSGVSAVTGNAVVGGGAAGAIFNVIQGEVTHALKTRHERAKERRLKRKLGKKRAKKERLKKTVQVIDRNIPRIIGGAVCLYFVFL